MVVAYAGEQEPQKQSSPFPPASSQNSIQQRQEQTDFVPAGPGPQQQTAPPAPQPRPSGPLQTLEGGFNVIRSDVSRGGQFVESEVGAGVTGYEKVTQPIRNFTQGPQLGTPAKYETVTTYKQGGPGAGLVPVESQVLVSPAQGPTNQQRAREGAFLAAGIVPGGDLLEVGARAGEAGFAAIASRLGLGAIYGGSTSALKGGTPEQIGESAAFSGAFLAAGPLAGRAGSALGSKFGDISDAIRTPSTIQEPTGTYSGTVGGRPGIISRAAGIFSKPPATPGEQLTDIPGGEAPIATRQFGEVFAQKKFGIEPGLGVNYEYEYGGPNKPFQYSAEQARQQDFGGTGGPAGPGFRGGGGIRQEQGFAEETTTLRTPPGSPFSETQFRTSLFQNAGEDVTPGFAAGLGIGQQGVSSSALKVVLPPLSTYKTVSGQSGSQSIGQSQSQQQGSGIRTTQGAGSGFQTYVQTTQQQTQQQQPTPDVTVLKGIAASPSTVTISPRGSQPFSAAFAQPPSLGVDKRRKKQNVLFREIKHPIGNILTGGNLRIASGFKVKRSRKR